jgi:phospholipase/carboxylesterase
MPPPKLNGPRLAPRSGNARQLVALLHGYGANGNDLIEIGRQWRDVMPDALFLAPHAPEICAQAPSGRQWFALTQREESQRWRGAVAARPALDAFLDQALADAGLDDSKLALVGFSQGSMMALHVGLRRPRAPAAVLAYSGVLVGADRLAEASARDAAGAPPPILLSHGDADEVIPAEAMFQSAEALAKAGIPAQWRLVPGLGHGIDPEGLAQGALFLAQSFGARTGTVAGARRRI